MLADREQARSFYEHLIPQFERSPTGILRGRPTAAGAQRSLLRVPLLL